MHSSPTAQKASQWGRLKRIRQYPSEERGTNLQSAGRELVKRFTSAMLMNPDASSSKASEMGCNQVTSMYLIALASGLRELLVALAPVHWVSEVDISK